MRRHTVLFISLVIMILSILGGCEKLEVTGLEMSDRFPISMTFSTFFGFNGNDLNVSMNEHEPIQIIHGASDRVFSKLRKLYPDKILLQQDAFGGIGIYKEDLENVWPGHLLLKTGTKLNKDCKGKDTILYIENYKSLANNQSQIDRTNKSYPFYLVLYALDDQGNPDWSRAEHLILTGLNAKNGAITVKRAQLGSKALTLEDGKAVVASHMMFWTSQWQLNFSLHCPRGGPDNLTAAEWYAKRKKERLDESGADGIEFDVARWTWGNPTLHPMDCNNDLIADYGYIDGVNSYGLGAQVFLRELRRLLGPDKIIQMDSNNALAGQRGYKYVNGVQLESFPKENHFDRFSEAFQHLRLWVENTETQSKFSYPFTKVPTTAFTNALQADGSSSDYRFRVGFAAALLTGMPHPFNNITGINFDPENPENNEAVDTAPSETERGLFLWDEYMGGDLNDWQWLGRAKGEARQIFDNMGNTDLLSGTSWVVKQQEGFNAEYTAKNNSYSVAVDMLPPNTIPWTNAFYTGTKVPKTLWFGVRLEPETMPDIKPGQEYTLVFEARGDDRWEYMEQTFEKVPRMIAIHGIASYENAQPASVMVDSDWKTYRISINADSKQPPNLILGVSEQIGMTQIRNIHLYEGGSERWVREFENGIVLLNMTKEPWQYKISGKYRRLKGELCPDVNNGEMVSGTITVPSWDAVYLVKERTGK